MFKDVSNVNRTRSSIRRNLENYTHSIYHKDQEISINVIGPLPKSNRMDAIVIIVDRFTKMIRLKATTTNISSENIAKIY